jgi:hypothetical protein
MTPEQRLINSLPLDQLWDATGVVFEGNSGLFG